MERLIRRAGLIGIVPVTLALLAGGGALIALDSDNESSASAGAPGGWSASLLANQDPEDDTPDMDERLGPAVFDDYLEKLAENLGISEDEFREAMEQTALDLLDEAVADGDISEEAAQKIREMIEDGGGFPLFGGGFLAPGLQPGFGALPELEGAVGPFFFGIGVHDDGELAGFFGISEEELREELNSGKTLAEVGEAHGKSRGDLTEFLNGQFEERLQDAVDSGKLDEEDAAEARERFAEHVDEMLDAQMRIHITEGELPEGFEERFGQFRDGGPGIFRAPWRSDEEPSESDETY